MKRLYLFLWVLPAFAAHAQIQITQASMPSIGDTIRYTNSSAGSLDFTKTGASYSWDYSTLDFLNQDIYKFQGLLSTPYGTLAFSGMPVGAIGYKVADSVGQGQASIRNIYNFYQKSSSGWYAVGTGFTMAALSLPAGGVYKDKDEIYSFPLKYNDQDSTTFEVITPLGSPLKLGTFTQKGYRINKVDGWGTITTPYGANISCIRVKSYIVETDSLKVSVPPVNIGFVNQRVEYKWLSTTEKIPVLEVNGTEIASVFTPTIVRYRDHYRNSAPQPLLPRVKFSADKTSGKAGLDTFRLLNNTTPTIGTTYQWSFSPSKGIRYINSTGSTSAEPVVIFDSAGIFSATLVASNTFGSKDSTAYNLFQISKDHSNGIAETRLTSIQIFPNPASSALTLRSEALTPGMIVAIYDASGRISDLQVLNEDMQIDISRLARGIYTLTILNLPIQLHTKFTK